MSGSTAGDPTPTVFEWASGTTAIRRLMDAFYDRVERDDLLARYFPDGVFYVEVPDVEAALARAEDLGGTRIFGPDKVPGTDVELGQFADPEGHMIGVTKATP
jgi:hypothetical protein